MAVELDNIHYDIRHLDGYNKAINIVIGPREPGKSTQGWVVKFYRKWKKCFKPWIVLERQAVAIDEAYIQSIFDNFINKFDDDNLEPIYSKGDVKKATGIIDIYVNWKVGSDKDGKPIYEKKRFLRIVSLSIKMARIKKAILKDCGGVIMDEFIINPKFGEKYLPQEFEKIEEAYTTWRREVDGVLKMYFFGNPYSLFNPLFVGLKVNIKKLKRGEIYIGDNFVIEWCILTPELRAYLLKVNPFYQFDEEYANYALDGCAINDDNIRLGTLPINFAINFVIKMDGKFIGIFKNNYLDHLEDKYFCKFLDKVAAERTIYCFNFTEMVNRTILVAKDEVKKLQRFKDAMRKRLVTFEDINVYYYLEEVYKNI